MFFFFNEMGDMVPQNFYLFILYRHLDLRIKIDIKNKHKNEHDFLIETKL